MDFQEEMKWSPVIAPDYLQGFLSVRTGVSPQTWTSSTAITQAASLLWAHNALGFKTWANRRQSDNIQVKNKSVCLKMTYLDLEMSRLCLYTLKLHRRGNSFPAHVSARRRSPAVRANWRRQPSNWENQAAVRDATASSVRTRIWFSRRRQADASPPSF